MDQLKSKEALVLRYITDRINDGVPPTVREICSELSIKSTSTAHKYLRSLEAKGYILMGDRTNRSIRLNVEKTVSVPLIGTVAAGQPILAIEEVEDYIPYRVRRGMGKDLFALRVKGESMVNAAILDGDIIIARRTPVAANGEIVVALVGDEATVKTFYKENGHFRLQPENDTMDPIIVEEVAILGKVISVLRFFE